MGYPYGQWRAVMQILGRRSPQRQGPIPPEMQFRSVAGEPINIIGYYNGGEGNRFLIVAAEKARQVPWYAPGKSEVNFIVLCEMELPDDPSPRWEAMQLVEEQSVPHPLVIGAATGEVEVPEVSCEPGTLLRSGTYEFCLSDS